MDANFETTMHYGYDVEWSQSPRGHIGKIGPLYIRIDRVLPGPAAAGGNNVIAFGPIRFKAFVEEALVDPQNVFQATLDEAKEKAVRLAIAIIERVDAARAKRRADMLRKFGLQEQQ